MFNQLIKFSIKNKLVVAFATLGLVVMGIWSILNISIDAVPDITNNQVQIVTISPTLAPQEIEQFITYPVEVAMSNLPYTTQIRSISRYGLSVVTVVFEENLPILEARQYIAEQIESAKQEIPIGMGNPEMMPITTGLGEIYQYRLVVDPKYSDQYSLLELRSIQDWIIKRQMSGTEGIIETGSFGGKLKQYEVAVDPIRLKNTETTLLEVHQALENNNANTGAGYIQKNAHAYYIRTNGLVKTKEDIENIVVSNHYQIPVLVKDVAEVCLGFSPRYGAMTADGEGETVGGITLMFKGENANKTIKNVKERMAMIQQSLPPGVKILPFLDRSELVDRSMNTVKTNLIEGALIVVFILVLLLGNYRAGLIVASVIPLSMLFAFCLMKVFGVSANLMSLGAVDFGLVLDGSIIVVEAALHRVYKKGKFSFTQKQMDEEVYTSSSKIRTSAAFGEIIILIVYLPILALVGIEGKMFTPMALTVGFAILGALILSLTYVPMMLSVFLKKKQEVKRTFADRIMEFFSKIYRPVLNFSLKRAKLVFTVSLAIFITAIIGFTRIGGEFIPTLEEGDLALQISMTPGTSLKQAVKTTTAIERILMEKFPEVKSVVSKIGTSEVPTDPMGIENADVVIAMKDKEEWTSASSRVSMQALMKKAIEKSVVGVNIEMTQPIQLRFNELISGTKADIAIKIFGEDLNELAKKGEEAQTIIKSISGVGDINLEQVTGLPQLMIDFNREQIARYGVSVADVNKIIKMAYAGEKAGVFYEGEKKFDLVTRLQTQDRETFRLDKLFIETPQGEQIMLSELAHVSILEGPNQISRENTQRKIVLGINARDRDIESIVGDIEQELNEKLQLKPGYFIRYGGNFENLQKAKERLSFALPLALFAILFLLYIAFGKMKYALLIFTTVPMSAIGGVAALFLRGMPFSISAGIGFIALFGVAVLDGVVLISTFRQLAKDHPDLDIISRIKKGALLRLRPVLVTSIVASFGFLPMALSNQAGAEVQKPLATVVIGGLFTATVLTLVLLPILYKFFEERKMKLSPKVLVLFLFISGFGYAQETITKESIVELGKKHLMSLKIQENNIQKAELNAKTNSIFGNTNINLALGELENIEEKGREVSLVQNFTNLYQWTQRRGYNQSLIKNSELALDVAILDAERVLKDRYTNWQKDTQLSDLQTRKLQILKKMFKHFEKKFQLGLVSKMDHQFINQELLKAELRIVELSNSISEHQRWLALNAGLQSQNFPTPLLYKMESKTESEYSVKPKIKEFLESGLTVLSKKEKSLKGNLFPALAIGWQNRQVNDLPQANSFILGLNFKFLNKRETQKSKLAKLEYELQEKQAAQQRLNWNLRLTQLLKSKSVFAKYASTFVIDERDLQDFENQLLFLIKKGDMNASEGLKQLNSFYSLQEQSIINLSKLAIIDNSLETYYTN
jgi:cobalt-zinc-cadmium resistance protein CzcA